MKTKGWLVSAGLPLTVAFGSIWMTGCLPTTEPDDAKYDINSYTVVQGDSGSLAGTWVLTSNKPYAASDVFPSVKGRAVFRLRPIDGIPDQLEAVYCVPETGDVFMSSPATIAGSLLTIVEQMDSPLFVAKELNEPFTIVDNNHLSKSVHTDGGVNHEFRAIKISNNPDLNIGTVGVSIPIAQKSALNQSALCLGEFETQLDTETHTYLTVSGTNNGITAAKGELLSINYAADGFTAVLEQSSLWDENGQQYGYPDADVSGSPSTNTVSSTTQSVKGTATAREDIGLPLPVTTAKTTFKVSL